MNGKGSVTRPKLVSEQKFSENWDKIFGKKKKSKEPWFHAQPTSGVRGKIPSIEDVFKK